jgi:FkbM family methyltransferase
MEFFYGIEDIMINVTEQVFEKCKFGNKIMIQSNDIERAKIFSDPIYGTLKSIFINQNGVITKYDHKTIVCVDLEKNLITSKNIEEELYNIHNKLKLDYGSFREELPEQYMAITFLTGIEKVLEIGGNIGRNSLIIGSIIKNSDFVVMECDENIAKQLEHNRNQNNMNFYIENSALSKRQLIQRGWDTIPSDVLLDGYKKVNTITCDELKSKYNIKFDTLVLDCEGAFYYILMDMPEVLDNINLIIMENDYYNIEHKNFVDNTLRENNFNVVYSLAGGWGCCYNNFFEVWRKKIE